MKKLTFFLILSTWLLLISCSKENPIAEQQLEQLQITATLESMEPNVFAGSDLHLVFPVAWTELKGSVQYPQLVKAVLWRKIAGPASYTIEKPGSLETNLRNLEKGNYLFELSVTDKSGLTGRDTVSVSVLEEGSGNNEIVFKDRQWVCPMGCHIRIEQIHSLIPAGIAFKIYIQRDHSAEWVEIRNNSQGFAKYVWTIYNNGLEILEDQTENPEDTPDIKLVF